MKPDATPDEARQVLAAQFGETGNISTASLGRIWNASGLTQPIRRQRETSTAPSRVTSPPSGTSADVQVEQYHGGGALALVAAAMAETGGHMKLAEAVQEACHRSAGMNKTTQPVLVDGRDGQGRFTSAFNRATRAGMRPGDKDPRLDPDRIKRQRRHIDTYRILEHSPSIIAYKLLAIGATPALSDSRGFDGLTGAKGEWLAILGGTAYMPATLDKALAELAELEVVQALEKSYTEWSTSLMLEWSRGEGSWQQKIIFVDATQDPYWTQQYAQSGKVSSVGKVMPCLSRIAVCGGAGPPLLVETVAGSVSLKTSLLPTLERLEGITGEDVWRFIVMDNEMCTPKILSELMRRKPHQYFVTVLKGALAEGADIRVTGIPQTYRERDRLEEGTVTLTGPEGEVLELRVVIMSRVDCRHPEDTIFLTDAPPEELDTDSVPDLYLSRWPAQEQSFRDMRNGGGLNHSHGYGGEYVTHVALQTTLEKCERRIPRAEKRAQQAQALCEQLEIERKHEANSGALNKALKLAQRSKAAADKYLETARGELEERQSTPRLIYKRDVTRDSIVTYATLMFLMLCEYVMREYFQGTRMMYRSIIEHYMHLPTTVLTYRDRIVYRIEVTARGPDHAAALRRACEEINRRRVHQGKRLLVFEVIDPPARKG
jgi:hypothetical protein